MKFSSNLAFSLATITSYEKGEEYFNDGAVLKNWKEDKIYKAIVEGTQKYTVSITPTSEEVHCTCPYEGEGICKHAVAAILVFSQLPEFASSNLEENSVIEDKKAQELDVLLEQSSEAQVRKFLKTILIANQNILNDFTIFLQGTKETTITVQWYAQSIKNMLDTLNLDELQETGYYSHEDYYEGYDRDDMYDDEIVEYIVNLFGEEAKKYAENNNFAESNKIYQAIIDALHKKIKEIEQSHPDVIYLFSSEYNTTIQSYVHMLVTVDDADVKLGSIEYLCVLFEYEQAQLDQVQIGEGVQKIITNEIEAQVALHALAKLQKKKELLPAESSLLSHLYILLQNDIVFEQLCLENLEKNSNLILRLLQYYQQQNRKADLLKNANRMLLYLHTQEAKELLTYQYSASGVEIQIRKLLKDVFDPQSEYTDRVHNLEELFLVSAQLMDYKELIRVYKNLSEKEIFLKRMKNTFTKKKNIKIMFKVFKFEHKKEDILELVRTYHDEDCFPDMISVLSNVYPTECFAAYTKKIKHLLIEANVKLYPQVAYHLKRMRSIGLNDEFQKLVKWIISTYSRRSRLIEELKKASII